MDNKTEKQMYFIKRGYGLQAKNNLQKEFLQRIADWDFYLIDSMEEFHDRVQEESDKCHANHSRCQPLRIGIPNSLHGDDGRYTIRVGELMCFEIYRIAGAWTKKGGFQPIVDTIQRHDFPTNFPILKSL